MNIDYGNINYFIQNWRSINIVDFNSYEWEAISMYQNLSEEFIEKYENELNWLWISYSQKLSERLIEKFEDEVDWYYVSKYQTLSEKFIYKNRYRIYNSTCLEKYYIKRDYNIYSKHNYSLMFYVATAKNILGLTVINKPYSIIMSDII